MEPVQMASSLTETFYDLYTGPVQPANHHSVFAHSHPPSALWTPRMDTYSSSTGEYSQAATLSGENANTVCKQENEPTSTEQATSSGDWAEEDEDAEDSSKETEKGGENSSQKHSQVVATLTWLTENYERVEGVCLPRCVLYTHYLDFCKKNTFTPAGAATFGKIIRQKFPKLTTRRLGTRGQSRYHYYGIGIKQTSVYYQSVYSGRGLTRFSGVKIKTEGSNRKYSLSSKTGTLLPEFPEVDNLILPDDVCPEKMKTLLMMYRTHCQRILDTVISANFDEVQNLLLHFWQGMPGHLTQLLHSDILCAIVALCDSILYKVLADILVPPSIQDIPDSLSAEIKLFTRKLPCWIGAALDSVPDSIRQRKIDSAKGFIQSVRRQLSFVHLAQTARSVLANQEGVAQMLEDLSDVDFRQVFCQAVYTQPVSAHSYRHTIMEFFTEFQSLLKKQSPVEAYTEWIDSIVDTFVLQPCKEKDIGFLDRSADFLLQWAMFGSLLMKELTLHNAISFGAFHLLHVMLDEYVFLVLETQREQSRDHQLQTHVQRHMKNWETIKIQAKVRAGGAKAGNSSPKAKKRKHEDVASNADEAEAGSERGHMLESRPHPAASGECLGEGAPPVGYETHSATAFTRPPPSVPHEASLPSEGPERVAAVPVPSSLPLSPVKHLNSVNCVTYDRPSYIPPFSLNTYSDYVSQNMTSAVSSARMPNYSEHHHAHTQSFPPVAGGVSGMHGSYWTDGRGHAVLSHPYSQYSHHGVASPYDSYKNAAFLRSSVYGQDALGIGPARGYFAGRAGDNYQSSLAVSSTYGGNYMEIAPGGAQYTRHDTLPAYQEDLYGSGMPSALPAFHKHYLAAPFR